MNRSGRSDCGSALARDLDVDRADQEPHAAFAWRAWAAASMRWTSSVSAFASVSPRLAPIRLGFSGVMMNSAPASRAAASAPDERDVLRHLIADVDLDQGGREYGRHRAAPSAGLGEHASSLPAFSSATISSVPPICSPPMKICGTDAPPGALAHFARASAVHHHILLVVLRALASSRPLARAQ